jgi:cation transport regulator ChaB
VAAALTVLKACAARLSYDVIKNRMIAAWSAYRKKSKRRKKKTRESDGVQPDQFIKSVQEYAKGLRNVNPVIQRAIREEIRAEATTSVIMEALKNARLRRTRNAKFRPTEEKAQVKILAKALRAAMAERTKDKVTINAFKGLESISAGGKAKRSSKSSGLRTKKRDKNS